MITPARLQFTSVRRRIVDGHVLIGLKHTGKDEEGVRVLLPWMEMPPGDVERLIVTLQQVLHGAEPAK
jgi:hypothetical protein